MQSQTEVKKFLNVQARAGHEEQAEEEEEPSDEEEEQEPLDCKWDEH